MNLRVAGLVVLSPLLTQPAIAQGDFIAGVYSSEEGCAALNKKDVEGDFIYLSATGFEGYEFNCEFVQVYPRKELPGFVAVAFCEEPGFSYPGLFSIIQLTDTTIWVGTPDTGAAEESEEEATPESTGEAEEEDTGLGGEYQLCPGS